MYKTNTSYYQTIKYTSIQKVYRSFLSMYPTQFMGGENILHIYKYVIFIPV